jgi:hypothetical protein
MMSDRNQRFPKGDFDGVAILGGRETTLVAN